MLLDLLDGKNAVGIIANAQDHKSDPERAQKVEGDVALLAAIGCNASEIDLREYFGDPDRLEQTLLGLDGVWVRGGGAFVLRQALAGSGGDVVIRDLVERDALVYAGESAGGCVLSTDMRPLLVAESGDEVGRLYGVEPAQQGLGVLGYTFIPHYSETPGEAEMDVRGVVAWCHENTVPYETVRDGEVLVRRGEESWVYAANSMERRSITQP